MSIIAIHNAQTSAAYGTRSVEILPVNTQTVPPYTTTNAVFIGRNAFWVVDPGTPFLDQQTLLKSYIEHRHKNGHRFLGICLTHHHGDHLKAAVYLATEFGVPIFAHHQASRFVSFAFRPLDDEDVVSDLGDLEVRALHTPGHSDDHLVYYISDLGILIAGDMITDRGTILIPPVSGSLRIYLDSLDKLTHLSLNAIIPAHGNVIENEPQKFLITAMKHRYERIKAVFTAIKAQDHDLDASDITRLVYQHSIADTLLPFAQLSVESSLQWLKEAGLIDNPRHYWQVNDTHDLQKILLDRLEEIDERLRNA